VVAKNREATTLSFPLNEPKYTAFKDSSATLQSKFTPSSDLERDLAAVLDQYG
jgi:U3 small nucleolar RNA-associated protein 14